jgi:tetratricopeptide (TPR) repeat protein
VLEPDSADTYLWRSLLHVDTSNYTEALADLDAGIKLAPKWGTLYYWRGLIYAELMRNSEAISDLEQALKLGLNEDQQAKAEDLLVRLKAPVTKPTTGKDGTAIAWNGLPIMPGARDGAAESSGYMFRTDRTVDDVVAYYKPQMLKLGWTLLTASTGRNNATMLIYTKGKASAAVATFVDKDMTYVILTYKAG